jgi:hypothetical protein
VVALLRNDGSGHHLLRHLPLLADLGSQDRLRVSQIGEMFTDVFEPCTRTSREMLNVSGPFAADLREMIANPTRWRQQDGSRRAFVFAGSGIADVAAAAVVYQHAVAGGSSISKKHTIPTDRRPLSQISS